MKFLILIEGVPVGPLEQMLTLTKEIWGWARRMRESGKAEAQYVLADRAGGLPGGVGIVNVGSGVVYRCQKAFGAFNWRELRSAFYGWPGCWRYGLEDWSSGHGLYLG